MIRRILLVLLFAANSLPAIADTLIVLNKAEATASLIDLSSNQVAATVATGIGPHEVSVSRDGKTAVVCNYGTREAPGSTLTVIDIPTATVRKTIELQPYARPHGIQWLDAKRCIVTAEANQAVAIVDVERGTVTQSIPTGQDISHMVATSADGKRAYVASIGSGTVTVLDLESGKKMVSVPTGKGSEGIDILPDGKEVWITNREADTISVLDTSTLNVTATLESKSFPIRARATRDGRFVLISNARSGDIAVFDVTTKKEIRRIRIPLESSSSEGRLFGDQFGNSSVPIGILTHPNGKLAFVAHANADVITILDLDEWKIAGSLKAGKEPDGLGYSGLSVSAATTQGSSDKSHR